MLRKHLKYYLIFLLAQSFVQLSVAGSDVPSVSSGDIQFYLDDASFLTQGKIHQEFYLMIFSDQLEITSRNGSDVADLSISAVVKNYSGKIILSESWETEARVIIDSSDHFSKVIYDQWVVNLDPGKYEIELMVEDNISGKSGKVERSFTAELDVNENILLSDIEFAGNVVQNNSVAEDDIFKKGSISVLPNPSRRFGLLNPVLYFYYEVYSKDVSKTESFLTGYQVHSNLGTQVRSFEGKEIKLTEPTIGIPAGLNVSALETGIYHLVVSVFNSNGEKVSEVSRQFEVIHPDYLNKRSILTHEQAETFGEIIRLISTEEKYDLYNKLDLTAKAKFILTFWRQNDPVPETNENELLKKIMQRYQYANENYTWGKKAGWKSDRGKVLIEFGMPDNIERYPSEQASFPYEIWEYQGRRGYIYVFGDLRNDGRYTLLHSNREGEIYNPYWKDELNKM